MNTTQYTIRNVPSDVDSYLRKKAKVTGKSLNKVVLDELQKQSRGSRKGSLDWFMGSGLDNATISALESEESHQKSLAKKELGL